MELATETKGNFYLPVILFEDKRFDHLSLPSKVLFSVLADLAFKYKDMLRIENVDEKTIKQYLSYTDKLYKQSKNQLKETGLLVELVDKKKVTYLLKLTKVGA